MENARLNSQTTLRIPKHHKKKHNNTNRKNIFKNYLQEKNQKAN